MTRSRLEGQYRRMVVASRRVRPALSMSDASFLAGIPITEPNRLRQAMVDLLGGHASRVVVTGTLERR
ncbi:MAG TPA: hypothetical protein VF892_14820, partial [Pseudonocardiaceae bacterium]